MRSLSFFSDKVKDKVTLFVSTVSLVRMKLVKVFGVKYFTSQKSSNSMSLLEGIEELHLSIILNYLDKMELLL